MLPRGGTEKIRRLRESKDVKHGLMKGIDDDVDGDGDGLTHPSLGQGGGEKGTTNDGDRVREVGRRESPLTGGGPSSSVSPLRGTIATFEFEDSKDRLEVCCQVDHLLFRVLIFSPCYSQCLSLYSTI